MNRHVMTGSTLTARQRRTVRRIAVGSPDLAGQLAAFPKPFLTTEELAELLQVDPSSVRRWRTVEPIQGPPFIQLSERSTIYSAADVHAWLMAKRVVPGARR
jgi:hypothetical protein